MRMQVITANVNFRSQSFSSASDHSDWSPIAPLTEQRPLHISFIYHRSSHNTFQHRSQARLVTVMKNKKRGLQNVNIKKSELSKHTTHQKHQLSYKGKQFDMSPLHNTHTPNIQQYFLPILIRQHFSLKNIF